MRNDGHFITLRQAPADHFLFSKTGIELVELKEWVQIARVGEYWDCRWDNPVSLTIALFKAVIARFKSDGIDIVFDINHASVWFGEAPAMAWADDLKIENNALYAHIKEWTPKGAEAVRNKEYRYISPTFSWSSVDRKSGKLGPALHSVALTNTPVIVDIEPLTLAAKPGAEPTPQGGIMDKIREWLVGRGVTLAATADEAAIIAALSQYADGLASAVPAALAKALGHADDKTPMSLDAATAALTAMQATVPAPLAQALGHAGASPMTLASAQAAVMTLQKPAGDVATLASEKAELVALRTAKFTSQVDDLVATGRATPKQKEVLMSQFGSDATRALATATVDTLAAGLPAGPLAPRLGEADGGIPGGAAGGEAVNEVAMNMGVDPEIVKKHSKKETANG